MDGRNPATLKPRETTVLLVFTGGIIIPRLLRWCEMDLVHPQYHFSSNIYCPQTSTWPVKTKWYHFGVGAPPMFVYFKGLWDVHWGYGSLTHGHISLGDSQAIGPPRPHPGAADLTWRSRLALSREAAYDGRSVHPMLRRTQPSSSRLCAIVQVQN